MSSSVALSVNESIGASIDQDFQNGIHHGIINVMYSKLSETIWTATYRINFTTINNITEYKTKNNIELQIKSQIYEKRQKRFY